MHPLGHTRTRRVAVALVVAFLVLAAFPGVVSADTRVQPQVTVAAGETLDGDLTTVAASVVILGTVDGDVTALAGQVTVRGRVTGDVTAVAGRVEVDGVVDGDLRTIGGATTVDGAVSGDVDAVVVNTSLTGRVGGDVDAVGGFVAVSPDARVDGGLRTTAVVTSVDGRVGAGESPGSGVPTENTSAAVFVPNPLRLAAIPAQTPFAGPGTATAVVAPAVEALPAQIGGLRVSLFDAYRLVVTMLLGGLLLLLLPRFSADVADAVVTHPGPVALAGFAVLIVTPTILLVLALSVFGLPLALAGAALLAVASWVGSVYGRYAVGAWAVSTVARGTRRLDAEIELPENRWLDLFVGVVLVWLVVQLPVVGAAVDALVLALGLGSLVRLGYGAYHRHERSGAATSSSDAATVADGGPSDRVDR
ncbi:bactofilin family protein [Halobaculum marinum]|uniref:Polymer-forming cytoskeletal protein n=1 Tax=Halobaculum marinum TaxID=3031996 RepID=A0ABD5X387_9EURY|nr:polymer-forming cytoskeletal protein [Halobaculum sp. DT55]